MRPAARKPVRQSTLRATLALAACALAALLLAPPASAAPPQLWQKCDADEPAGQRCSIPRGVAADPRNGHVFVADSANTNNRAVELDPLGNFVRAWGWDVVASGPGDDAEAPEDEFEVCVPEDGDVCKGGTRGAGTGQFAGIQGIAVDSDGSVWAVDRANGRVQKFSPAGEFLLMLGGEVNETSGGNVCPRPGFPADVCKAEAAASGGGEPGEFGGSEWAIGSFIAIDPADNVHVGDVERIQRFDTEGAYQDEIELPGETVQSLATDSAGNLYYVPAVGSVDAGRIKKLSPAGAPLTPTFIVTDPDGGEQDASAVAVAPSGNVFAFGPPSFKNGVPIDPVFEFDPAGNEIDNFGKNEFSASTGLATNLCAGSEEPGNLYVTNTNDPAFIRAYGTAPEGCFNAFTGQASNIEEDAATLNGTINPQGAAVSECRFEYGTTTAYGSEAPCAESPAEIGEGEEAVPVHADLSGLTKATVYHFRLRATIGAAAEKGADQSFTTLGPPIVTDEHTVGATFTEITVAAQVNPDGQPTSWRIEYGSGEELTQSTTETALGHQDRSPHGVTKTIAGLDPGTAYRWRIVATNPAGETQGEELSATTYRPFAPKTDCPNQALRTGPSAALPDCRAYEMVSPVDKNGSDIRNSKVLNGPAGYIQSSLDGNKLAYGALGATFGDQPAGFFVNQYIATRKAGQGWSNHGIHPPYTGQIAGAGDTLIGLLREFQAFTPDLCRAWLVDFQTPPLRADAQEDYPNLYRQENCGGDAGKLQTLTIAPLPEGTAGQYVTADSVQGASADGERAFFTAGARFFAEASPGGNAQVYERHPGGLSLVSVLPGGEAATGTSAVGGGWDQNLAGAVSEDGSRVYWTTAGELYLRTNPEQGVVAGECTTPASPCTIAVSTGEDSFFWGASPDGSKALYSEGDLGVGAAGGTAELYEFDLGRQEAGEEASRLIAEDIEGVAGHSEDLSRVYFVSHTALPEAGPNSEGEEALEGEPNLYLAEGGPPVFVATLVGGDVGELETGFRAYDVAARGHEERATRVSPDGARIAFNSRARLTGYDNTAANGKPAVEVYLYDAETAELVCASCNPAGARPQAVELPEPFIDVSSELGLTGAFAAAWIPSREQPQHASNVLSEDGRRLFFNSLDALVPHDTNGQMDVYQWEAPGKGSCTKASPSYFAQNGGCVQLISTGESPFESEFWEASPDGRDVFFSTESSLLPQDPGLVDLYDARAGGGIPVAVQRASCEGEACQSPPGPPDDPTPASAAFRGPGNVVEGSARRSCRGQARRAQRLSRAAKRSRRAAKRIARRSANRAQIRRMNRRARRHAKRAKRVSAKAKRCRRANRRASR